MGLPNEVNSALIGAAAAGGYEIEQSLRFNSGDNTYFDRTPSSVGNRQTWTYSAWIKLSKVTDDVNTILAGGNYNFGTWIWFRDGGHFAIGRYQSGSYTFLVEAGGFYRDPSAWYHVVVKYDTTQSTASDRIKLYVNNEQVTTFTNASYPSQNFESDINNDSIHWIGRRSDNQLRIDGYLAEVHLVDGTALDPTSFGEYDNAGVWRPIAYSGSHGTNGFYLDFSNSSDLGEDQAGSNDWTPNNFTTSGTGTDVLSDTPTNNFCTWNPIGRGPGVYTPRDLSNGNLELNYIRSGIGDWFATTTWSFPSSGNFYWECTVIATGSYFMLLGIAEQDWTWNTSPNVRYISSDGKISNHPSNPQSNYSYVGATYGLNDVIGMAWNGTNKTLQFYKNGTAQGSPLAPTATERRTFCPVFHAAADNWKVALNAGQRDFSYTPPTGYLPLNTASLPTPDIADGSEYFNAKTYNGDGGATQSITGVGFQPDWLWIKQRNSTENHRLVDSVRGVGSGTNETKMLNANTTDAEGSNSQIASFDSDGWTFNSSDNGINGSGQTYVGWTWKAGGSSSSNTAGSITSTVSASPTSGFSIATFTGNGSTATVGHGLGVAPRFVIVRKRSGGTMGAGYSDWCVYSQALVDASGQSDAFVYLNSTAAKSNSSSVFGSAPTSTVFNIGNNQLINNSGSLFVAYCFAEIEGYSKFGSYIGNGSSNGIFVYTGHRPAWILVKCTSTAGEPWFVLDTTRSPYNVSLAYLVPSSNQAEVSDANTLQLDLLSNGFRFRSGGGNVNGSGRTYIYMSLAENPFGGDGVSPATAR